LDVDLIQRQLADLTRPTLIRSYGLDECPVIRIKYVGSEQSCIIKVTTAGTGNITSDIGDVGSEAADDNFTLPSGGTGGTLDVSDASADTMQEVVEFINSLDDYECELVGALPADSTDTTLLADATGQQAKCDSGIYLYSDSSYSKMHSAVIKASDFLWKSDFGGSAHPRTGVEYGRIAVIDAVSVVAAWSAGTPQWEFYQMKGMSYDTDNQLTLTFSVATTVLEEINFKERWGRGLICKPDHYWLVKVTNTTDWVTALSNFAVIGHLL
jgi:hypothetical protein